MSLVVNARDAMPDGGRLGLSAQEGRLPDDSPAVALSVSDSGVGMTADVTQRAALPFFTTKTNAPWAGMGLSAVYGFVRQSGGSMTVRSSSNAGTTVTLYLPQHRAEAQTGPKHPLEPRIDMCDQRRGCRRRHAARDRAPSPSLAGPCRRECRDCASWLMRVKTRAGLVHRLGWSFGRSQVRILMCTSVARLIVVMSVRANKVENNNAGSLARRRAAADRAGMARHRCHDQFGPAFLALGRHGQRGHDAAECRRGHRSRSARAR